MNHLELMNQLLATATQRALNAEELDLINSHPQGFSGLIGLRFTHISRGEVRAELEVKPEHHQPWGVANGGLYCSIAETAASIASVVAAGTPAVGVNNSTDFIRSCSAGALEAVATPIQLGRRTHVWNIEMTQGGELIARSTLRTMITG